MPWEKELRIHNPQGLHARAASAFVKTVQRLSSEPPPDVLEAIDEYINAFLELLLTNEEQANAEVERLIKRKREKA